VLYYIRQIVVRIIGLMSPPLMWHIFYISIGAFERDETFEVWKCKNKLSFNFFLKILLFAIWIFLFVIMSLWEPARDNWLFSHLWEPAFWELAW